jgi:DNA-binding transcriptional LysR family regulator
MHKSQPSLSMAIKKLEEEFQIQLFNREDYRPKLTEAGKVFYQKAQRALAQMYELETLGHELAKSDEAEINISLDAIVPINLLKKEFQKFFDPLIATSLNLSIDILEGTLEKVVEGECDFGLGSLFIEDSSIESILFNEIDMVPVIAKENEKKMKDLLEMPQIVISSSSKNRSDKTVGTLEGGKKWFTSDIHMKYELIKNGLGWGRLPLHIIENDLKNGSLEEIQSVRGIHRLKVPLYLIKNKKHTMGPNTKRLWNYLISLSDNTKK